MPLVVYVYTYNGALDLANQAGGRSRLPLVGGVFVAVLAVAIIVSHLLPGGGVTQPKAIRDNRGSRHGHTAPYGDCRADYINDCEGARFHRTRMGSVVCYPRDYRRCWRVLRQDTLKWMGSRCGIRRPDRHRRREQRGAALQQAGDRAGTRVPPRKPARLSRRRPRRRRGPAAKACATCGSRWRLSGSAQSETPPVSATGGVSLLPLPSDYPPTARGLARRSAGWARRVEYGRT